MVYVMVFLGVVAGTALGFVLGVSYVHYKRKQYFDKKFDNKHKRVL